MARWALISGVDSSETVACALEAVDALRKAGVRTAGFVQVRFRDGEGRKLYDVMRLTTGARLPLAIPAPPPKTPEEAGCSLVFRNDSFDIARRWLEEDAPGAKVLVVDNIGKTELEGKGNAAALAWALERPDDVVVLFCTRRNQLSQVFERFSLSDAMVAGLELPAAASEIDAFKAALV
jgi:nucleoside-triphosphatase THEP1